MDVQTQVCIGSNYQLTLEHDILGLQVSSSCIAYATCCIGRSNMLCLLKYFPMLTNIIIAKLLMPVTIYKLNDI